MLLCTTCREPRRETDPASREHHWHCALRASHGASVPPPLPATQATGMWEVSFRKHLTPELTPAACKMQQQKRRRQNCGFVMSVCAHGSGRRVSAWQTTLRLYMPLSRVLILFPSSQALRGSWRIPLICWVCALYPTIHWPSHHMPTVGRASRGLQNTNTYRAGTFTHIFTPMGYL